MMPRTIQEAKAQHKERERERKTKGSVEQLKSNYALGPKLKIIKILEALHDVKWKKKTIN